MTSAQLQQWMTHPEQLNRETLGQLREAVAKYPYFQTAWLLYLKNLYGENNGSFGTELRKAIPYVADRTMLFRLTEGARYALQVQAAPEVPASDEASEGGDRTLTLINAFLAQEPAEQEHPAPVGKLDYAMDYTAYLLQEDGPGEEEKTPAGTPPLRGQDLIDNFIQGKSEVSPAFREEEAASPRDIAPASEASCQEEGMDESCFTETLAKIYIKQHRYEKALEIIKKLSLNYPKKNAYFADQIRFLEKLIINANSK